MRRNVIMNVAVSLDGFIEGPNGEYDWCFNDQDYGMEAFYANTDTLFIGRKSFEIIRNDLDMFPVPNIYVFSDSLEPEENEKFKVISRDDFDAKVDAILNAEGGDIWLFGGAELISIFMQKRLVSELLMAIHPIVLGEGKALFQEIKSRVQLNLLDSKAYDSGLLQVRYELKPWFNPETLPLL
ncbi:dihydrofolate reductase [Mucilaginibacter achroorhodeus]|uniref:Dihydrofolate reductase n=1 Tax=Mucilaginibacter achroorhodeus TaxID=2599294 RepID=A0A563UAY1_9SPHI|nr:dihydrofolate reductase family protein [Mucilaginibacter achroorhodeus]TWR28429.1 dihydrofolate reductase [Mucilaginibacter achroorhodeus]